MTKRLQVRPDDDGTITISHACNTYGLQHYRLFKDNKEFIVAKDYSRHLFYLIDVKDHSIIGTLHITKDSDFLEFLMKQKYEVTILVEE
jgi:hypothetical protein